MQRASKSARESLLQRTALGGLIVAACWQAAALRAVAAESAAGRVEGASSQAEDRLDPARFDAFTLSDFRGQEHALAAYRDSQLVVVAFLGVECPLAKLYAPRLQRLADAYETQGVAFLAVNPNAQDTLAEMASYAARHALRIPLLKDAGNRLADALGVTRTPEVVVLDRQRAIVYRGRIDDQYVIGVVRNAPSREDLKCAIEQALAGTPIETPATEPVGCLIGRVRTPDEQATVTYRNAIAPLLQRACVQCHREGEIGPFALTSYDEAAGWGEMMAEVVQERRMPPWHADPRHGTFANDRSLSAAERELFAAWAAAGCPEGDAGPPLPEVEFPQGWQMGRAPDEIFPMADAPFDVPAEAGPEGVPYQHFRVPSGFAEERWIAGAEVQPGNRLVVHHIIVYADPPKSRGRRDWIFITAYVPGLRYDPLPPGAAKRVPAGATWIFEQHYTPVGSPQQDLSRIGVVYADPAEVTHEAATVEIGNVSFAIPPGDNAHEVTATSRAFRRPLTLLSMSPHMHLRGKAFSYELVTPDGGRQKLLDVPRYDFNWQTRYVLAEPIEIPAGGLVYCRAEFDNSADNPANPDPQATVRWGEQSWEEMMLGFFDVMIPRNDQQPARRLVDTGLDVVGNFDRLDADGDRLVTRAEAEGFDLVQKHYDSIDADGDGQLTLPEMLAAVRRLGR